MGDTHGSADRGPRHLVNLTEYWIDKCPVTNEQYAQFVQEMDVQRDDRWKKAFTLGKESHPVVNVPWDDARSYGEWCGKRLPSEAEWEKAARGIDDSHTPGGMNGMAISVMFQ
jgi:formylglycine-generating enzyme required for sulfatase activity